MSPTEEMMLDQLPSLADHAVDVADEQRARKRVLLISYHFPPVGGAGVQRPVKFVKYLRQFGWDVSVLMAANPSVPLVDKSLCADLPDDLLIEKAVTWEPGYAFKKQLSDNKSSTNPGIAARMKGQLKQFLRNSASLVLQPDAQVLWLPNALKAAKRLLKRVPHDAILATAPPYSNLLLGGMLKKKFGLPLVVDFRDEWDLSSLYLENSPRNPLALQMQRYLQRHILRRADAIVATTKASTARLQERAVAAGSKADGICIYNGFDPADFSNPDQQKTRSSTSRYRLVYTGTLWNLTNVAPVVEAIERLHQESPEVLRALELVFVGRKTPQQRELLDRLSLLGCDIRNTDYCPHADALKLMREADGLCLLLSDVPGAERVAPAKLFEYLAARRPMLAVTPIGETADIVRKFFPEGHFTPDNVAGIADWICDQVVRFQSLGPAEPLGEGGIQEFSRPRQAGQLADLLDQVTRNVSAGGAGR